MYIIYGCYFNFHYALYTQVSQAVAASGLPGTVWAVVDLYGKCAAVTLTDPNSDQVRLRLFDINYIITIIIHILSFNLFNHTFYILQEARILSNALTNEATAAASASFHQAVNQIR